MPDLPNLVARAIIKAAIQATNDLQEGCLPFQEVGARNEQWVQSYAGIRLNDALREDYDDPEGIYVTFEASEGWMPYHTSSVGADIVLKNGRERYDLAVWSSDGFVIGLIEIKNAPAMDTSRFAVDAQRLATAIDRWGEPKGSLDWGIMLFSVRLSQSGLALDNRLQVQTVFNKRLEVILKAVGARFLRHWFELAEPDEPRCCAGWGAILIQQGIRR